MATKRNSAFVEQLNEVFRLFGPISAKRMFGGHGVYHDGLMIGLVADDMLYLKTDLLSISLFEEAGCYPFEYTKNGVTMKMSYWSSPEEIFENADMARAWAMRAFEAAQRAKSKSPKVKK